MKILLAAKHPHGGKLSFGGVQSWMLTIYDELGNMGHEPRMWGPEMALPCERFDLGIFANTRYTRPAMKLCNRTLVVSHGIIPDEQPTGGDACAFTSEEVRDRWGMDGPVIRQPIDLRFWKPAPARRIYLTQFSYRGKLDFVPRMASDMGLKYRHIHNSTPREARDILRQSACVLATGRAALEAMACGAPTVICDHRSQYQGPLMDTDIEHAMMHNYSGRGGMVPTLENVREAIMNAKANTFHVAKHHMARGIALQLLSQ